MSVEIVVDGRTVEAEPGELLVHALARAGARVPTLCHDEKLDPYGGCRLCTVELEGAPRPVASCATRVEAGMVVSTADGHRDTVVKMLLSEHLHPTPDGRPNELIELASELRASPPFVLPDAGREPYADRNLLLGYDPDACILCNRCVRYAREVAQCSALSLLGRGAEARVAPTAGRSWLDTECELCGGCLSVCPTGAIFEKQATVPERALRKVRTTCGYCGVGCQLDLNVDPASGRIVKVTSRREYAPNEGDLCVKGRFAFQFVHSPERLTTPLVRGEDGELHEATWDDALARAAAGLRSVQAKHGRHSVAVLSSARLTMEENYLIQKLARIGLGVNSVHSCEAT